MMASLAEKSVIFSSVSVPKNYSSLNVIENREASKVLINGMILQYLGSLQKSLRPWFRGLTSSQARWRKRSFILWSMLPSVSLCASCSWTAASSQIQGKKKPSHFHRVSRESGLYKIWRGAHFQTHIPGCGLRALVFEWWRLQTFFIY